jgi:hypothetical protein
MISKTEKLRRCVGCRNNRYNMGKGFQESPFDAMVTCDECWNLADATICNKQVYYSPNDVVYHLRKHTLSCWCNDMGFGKIC